MARKDIFGSVMGPASAVADAQDVSSYAVRGASRSIIQSFQELSKGSVVDLDPDLVDTSFVSDRIDDDDEAFQELLVAIRERGQDSPVLVRPHPDISGRFQTVFGHRRVRVARQLERPVRAVVKKMDDRDHVIAQGQENAARADLSFIERTLFADRILKRGHSPDTVKSALALDDTTFSKMRSVTSTIPEQVILAVGAAKGVGRDRWWQLAKLMEHPGAAAKAMECVSRADFAQQGSEARFARLFDLVSALEKRPRAAAKPKERAWMPQDKSVQAKITDTGKVFTLAFKSKEALPFGTFIAGKLDELFEAFRESEMAKKTGD
ncbi:MULTISPECIES: plasmid partitioning protein RepB [unclassified Mesorhizobium]|uniref:plasmid partitioning protein RepB n=1 Tax=unclassified Mesorhizobium TaxID=325217 RepID=UPI00112BF7BD|nr:MULTISPECIES: plasmid partitioning protein RepB [unclassified Mesorhizobium]TPJ39729.1 plasmid partitioning protein RepB [Mesorhizobium sp. B2-6-6]MBZ9894529.1 plasmid partitioning protein RepB [Mesorhizobium sp. BR1-1-6]MBZ9982481.1 plasmid partitioning protein RepB [Mesorhizobium sp. BR-1-1-8]MCA0008816.1 plasmid partitioning protein RepB [Mesorhizobium sp. B264B1B]MCA0021915.1 plasmid partitioning protein RepB [Mesorhizobium sp. B264B1A]